jgi:acetyltransferase-like isoleucine patch superfamily enzyme
MANKKFSEFDLKTVSTDVDFIVGYTSTDNVRIDPANLGGGATDLDGLSDCDTTTSGQGSMFIGNVPSGLATDAYYNTGLGYSSLNSLTTANYNTALGRNTLKTITNSEGHNTAVGASSLETGSSQQYSTAIGSAAANAATGREGVYVGYLSGRVNTSQGHISIGYQAGYSQTSGTQNTNLGYKAGYSNTTSQGRTMIGYNAGELHTGNFNTGVGRSACRQGTGTGNTSVGYTALGGNISSGGYNTAIGVNCMMSNGTKSRNTAVGGEAGRLLSTGSYNTIMGYQSGDNLTTGSNNILIGYGATASSVSVSNEITLGDANITALRCQVQTISALSDNRDKTNVKPSSYGLDLISKLNPVTFEWDMRDGAKVGDKDLGFIAQELQEVDDENLQLVYTNNPDRLEASYGRLIPVLVKAIQELKSELDNCKNHK